MLNAEKVRSVYRPGRSRNGWPCRTIKVEERSNITGRERTAFGEQKVNDPVISSKKVNILMEAGYINGCKKIFIPRQTTIQEEG